MEGIYLIIVMVITGGAIAFIGDKLGTKIGKKRLSIFGLRPRHTSMIITVITGALITGLSIGSMAIISDNVRTALFGMEELNAAMAATEKSLGVVSKELAETQEEFKRADEDLENSKREIESLKVEQNELREESDRLKSGNERLEADKSELTAQNENLSSTNSELSTQNKNLSSTNAELAGNNKKLGEFNLTLTADNEKLSKDNAELEERAKNLREGLIAIREGDIILKAGEVLASGVIQGGRSSSEIESDIHQIADNATRNIVNQFGNDFDGSVWIYEPELRDAVEKISAGNQEIILRISAASNLVRGEPIRTSLSIYPNNPVYEQGALVFAGNYEVNDEDDAEEIVHNFLTEVNHAAVERGILADPITHAVGVMEAPQLYELMEKISQVHGKISLTATAREATRSIGPLRLNISLVEKK